MKIHKILLALVAIATAIVAAPAMATPVVGEAVTGVGGSTIDTGPGDWIDFYIPLNDERNFDGSLPVDTCNANGDGVGTCTGGTLHLFLEFEVDWSGDTQIVIDFEDLDALGYADTDFFLEVLGLQVLAADGTVILTLSESDVLAFLSGDSDTQQLIIDANVDGDFYIHLILGTEFDEGTDGWYRNTSESLRAEAVSVPEPGTLALLGIGLLFIAFSRRRRSVEIKH